MKVTTVWCEYDIGINENVYSCESVARNYAGKALASCGLDGTVSDLEGDGLIGFDTIRVITE